jgi:hypothetical protein
LLPLARQVPDDAAEESGMGLRMNLFRHPVPASKTRAARAPSDAR